MSTWNPFAGGAAGLNPGNSPAGWDGEELPHPRSPATTSSTTRRTGHLLRAWTISPARSSRQALLDDEDPGAAAFLHCVRPPCRVTRMKASAGERGSDDEGPPRGVRASNG